MSVLPENDVKTATQDVNTDPLSTEAAIQSGEHPAQQEIAKPDVLKSASGIDPVAGPILDAGGSRFDQQSPPPGSETEPAGPPRPTTPQPGRGSSTPDGDGVTRPARRKKNDDLSSLLKDAKIVALFGQRTGRLVDNSLQCSIADVVSKPDLLWSDSQVVSLQSALNEAVKALAPVTLLDLRSGWNPFARSWWRMVSSSVKNTLFLVFAGLLIVAAGASTFVLNKGTGIVVALEKLKEQEPQRRIGQLQRQLLNAQPPPAADNTAEKILAREAYFNTLDDLREIDQRLAIYMPLSQSFPSEYGDLLKMAEDKFWQPAPPVAGQNSADQNNGKRQPQTVDPAGPNGSYGYASMNISCELAKTSGRYPESPFAKTEIGKMLIHYQADALDLFCYQSLLYQPSMIPPIEARLGEMNAAISVYALWVLPALYGALGATIFFMRSVLDRLTPDPPFSKIVLRIALGALAGIILGWFWSPENALSSEIAKVGFSLFATSFIVGFSIDIFFAMMDRFVKATSDFFAGAGASQQAAVNPPPA